MSNIPLKRLLIFIPKRYFTTKPIKTPPKPTDITVTQHPLATSFTVQYLTNSCGLSLKSALTACKKVNLEEKNKNKYDSVISCLKNHSFSDAHVKELVEKRPTALNLRISSNIESKIRFLVENGIPKEVVPKVLVSNPNIMERSIEDQLKPAMDFVKEFVCDDSKILVVLDRGSWILTCDLRKILMPNVELLLKEGVPKERIAELIVLQPRCVFYHDVERVVEGVNLIKSFGVKTNARAFVSCLRVVLSLSNSTWKRKVEFLESLGWSRDDVVSTFVRSPGCFSLSEEKIRDGMEFLVDTAKIDPDVVIGYPKLLIYSVRSRIAPRYAVWKILEDRGLLSGQKFVWVLNKSNKEFVDQYITRYLDEIPHLMSIYTNKMGRAFA